VDRDLQLVKQFVSYEKGWNVTFMHPLPNVAMFATVAERQGQPAQLKLWDLNKVLGKEVDPQGYHALVHIKNGSNAYPITCITASQGFNIVGVGYANGVVIVIRGDLLRDRGSSQTVAYKNLDPITGVELIQDNNSDPLLYITTTSKVLYVQTTHTYRPSSEVILDTKGADLGNVILDKDQLVIAKPDGLMYYSTDGSHFLVPLQMHKKRIFKYGKHVLIVTSNTQESTNLILNGYTEPTKMVIADMEHKLISMTHSIASTIQHIFTLWDDLYCLSSDGLLYKIHERAVDSQIETVMKRGLYPIAIQIATDAVDSTKLLEIKRAYADYLYSKNETTEAMGQYIETLSLGKTSEIIQMYKDSKEVANLSRFLEEMLRSGMALKEHVTLLLCTYCKLKQVDKLDEFIKRYDKETNDLMKVEFDLDVVIELCRDTGFLDQASKLSQNLGYPSLAVDILLRDNHDVHAALNYIKILPVDELLRVLVQYARLLLDASPNVTTALLIDVFTGKYKPMEKEAFVIDETPVLLQSYKAFVNYMSNLKPQDETIEEEKQDTYQPPRPRIIFPSFVNRPNEFVIFLEACAESYDIFEGNIKDKNDVLITLYELYLTIGSQSETPEEWHKKALELIKNNELDSNSILLISNVFDFDQGEIIAREGPGFQIDLFRSYVASGDIENCISVLEQYGEDEPELYSLALMFYTSSETVFAKVGQTRFRQLLDRIRQEEIMTPLEFIQALSVNNVTTVDVIKDYIVEFMESERREIDINEKFIQSYKKDIDTQREKIHKISEHVTIQPTNCASCSMKLGVDTVHFRCSHSYHKSCLSDDVCPLCAPTRETLQNIRENQKAIGERNELFQATLEDSEDRFRVITDFFGKGAMAKIGDRKY
jgi:CRISPR/Cas system-associated exonuclease Cas4 (RecB family)